MKVVFTLIATWVMTFSVVAHSADFTDQKPTSSQLIEALKSEGGKAQPKAGFKTRSLPGGTRGLSVMPEPPKSVNLTINFEFNSAQLTKDAMETLDQLGQAMVSDQLGKDQFRIIGHTDAKGDMHYNDRLSQERAVAVSRYLSWKFSINESRLEAQGMGENDLLDVSNPMSAKNRRVEVMNMGAQ